MGSGRRAPCRVRLLSRALVDRISGVEICALAALHSFRQRCPELKASVLRGAIPNRRNDGGIPTGTGCPRLTQEDGQEPFGGRERFPG
jgi:hypothetical protein